VSAEQSAANAAASSASATKSETSAAASSVSAEQSANNAEASSVSAAKSESKVVETAERMSSVMLADNASDAKLKSAANPTAWVFYPEGK